MDLKRSNPGSFCSNLIFEPPLPSFRPPRIITNYMDFRQNAVISWNSTSKLAVYVAQIALKSTQSVSMREIHFIFTVQK